MIINFGNFFIGKMRQERKKCFAHFEGGAKASPWKHIISAFISSSMASHVLSVYQLACVRWSIWRRDLKKGTYG